MTKRKNNGTIKIFLAVLVLAILGIAGLQGLSIVNTQAYLPEYLTGRCIQRADSSQVFDLGKIDNKGEFFECTSSGNGKGKWIPNVVGVQCEYIVEETGFSYSIYECPVDADEDLVSEKCTKLSGQLNVRDDKSSYFIDAGNKIWINPTSFLGFGGAELEASFPSYGLEIRQADGFVQKTTTSCLANTIPSDVHTINLNDRLEVKPDNPFNAVSKLALAKSTQLVSLDRVEGGNTVYISRPANYFKVKSAEDGFLYVDTSREYSDSSIECIPRTTGCSDDARIIQLEDQSCGLIGGAVIDYAPVQGDSTKLCKYTCEAGTLSATNDCITIPEDCPDDKPLFDSATGKCVAQGFSPAETGGTSPILWVALAVLVAILMMVLVKQQLDKRK
jgi:hypothetical protein